jgi:hypothetical protein
MRKANEIDFWRGFALASIFANHIPGFFFERFTHRNFGLSDSAELFVFLAGWSVRLLANSSEGFSLPRLMLRLAARAVTIYAAQILITMIAIALIATASLWFDQPLLLEWHNAAAVFQDPAQAHVGLVLLTHQLGFFDILPLYVVLMAGAPFMAAVDRLMPWLLLPASLAIYVLALTFNVNLPTWPTEGVWYFNPFAWQLIFVLGFVLAREDGVGGFVSRHFAPLRIAALPIVIAGVVVVLMNYAPDPFRVPWPPLLFLFDKTYLSPARLIHFLALAAVFAGDFAYIIRFLKPVGRFLSMLGRNSLNVFCVGSVCSLLGQLVRFILGGSLWVDTAVLISGLAAMGLTAWLSELRERLRSRSAALAASA